MYQGKARKNTKYSGSVNQKHWRAIKMTLKKPKSIRKFISVIPLHRTNNLHYKSIDWFLHNAVFTASNFEQI